MLPAAPAEFVVSLAFAAISSEFMSRLSVIPVPETGLLVKMMAAAATRILTAGSGDRSPRPQRLRKCALVEIVELAADG